jgi:hypothetical protein
MPAMFLVRSAVTSGFGKGLGRKSVLVAVESQLLPDNPPDSVHLKKVRGLEL